MASTISPSPLNWVTKEREGRTTKDRSAEGQGERVVRILIADERPIFRDGLRMLLEATPGFMVVGEAGDKESLLTQARERMPDVVLLDLTVAQGDEMSILHALSSAERPVRTLLFTVENQKSEMLRVLQLGARGVILRGAGLAQLWMNGVILFGMGVVLLLLAAKRFSKMTV